MIVEGDDLREEESFREVLTESLKVWGENGVRGCWLKIPKEKAARVPIAVLEGFEFHHCETDYVMITKWLPQMKENKLPSPATHHVGVGCFVTRKNPPDANKTNVLMVQKLRGPEAAIGDLWELPTGLLELGKDIPDGAQREVLEEMGVKTEFESILSARQTHGTHFGRSDIFSSSLSRL